MSSKKTRQPARPTAFRKVIHAIAESTGIGSIARAAVEAEDGLIDRLVEKARKHNVSEARIRAALAAKRKYDRAMSVVALLYPFLPNPALVRLVAGRKKRTSSSNSTPATPRARTSTSRGRQLVDEG